MLFRSGDNGDREACVKGVDHPRTAKATDAVACDQKGKKRQALFGLAEDMADGVDHVVIDKQHDGNGAGAEAGHTQAGKANQNTLEE